MSKHPHHLAYPEGSTDLAVTALLTVWSSLANYHNDCEAGPFLVLKLNAFAHRQQPKDAFDVHQTVVHYDGGIEAAAKGFRIEAESNSGFKVAADTLATHFAAVDGGGPTRCAEFMIGGLQGQMSRDEFAFRRSQIQNEMVSVADLLRR